MAANDRRHRLGNLRVEGLYDAVDLVRIHRPARVFSVSVVRRGVHRGGSQSFLNLPERSPADTGEHELIADLISVTRVKAEYMSGELSCADSGTSRDFWINYFVTRRAPAGRVQLKDTTGAMTVLRENPTTSIRQKRHRHGCAALQQPVEDIHATAVSAILIRRLVAGGWPVRPCVQCRLRG